MMLILDSSQPDTLLLGLKSGRTIRHGRFVVQAGRNEIVLRHLNQFLSRQGVSPLDLRSLLVVLGPGRFTSLRVAAAIANMMAWHLNLKLYGTRSAPLVPNDVTYLKLLDRRKHSIPHARPFYGTPPSISKSARSTKTLRTRS